MSRTLPGRAIALGALSAVLLASCGRPPHPAPATDDIAVRFAVSRDHREALLQAMTTDLVLRIDGRATGRLPALPATLELAAPDRMRLRVSALVGVALDVLVARDSLFAWIPSQRVAFAAPGESLGLGSPALLAARALGATWSPPAAAWRDARADSAGAHPAWREGRDSIALDVDARGRPVQAWIGRDGRGLRVRWSDWASLRGEEFPLRVEAADDSGWVRVRVQCAEPEAPDRADDRWFAARTAQGWRRMQLDDLKSVLQRRGLP